MSVQDFCITVAEFIYKILFYCFCFLLFYLCFSPDSDQFSDMTDSDADKKRRGLRRGQHQQVNYRETSESSDNSPASTNRNKVKPRGRPRKERLSSDYSNGQSPIVSAAPFTAQHKLS